ncbi:hypothetical protein QC761_203510 [Podospora bellae-mahoneyi]|uniref:Uncharacterized protein n=1 Tax=Podospora bellae-mahoneyi TaxID=2093777 RepID=A0ABR0FSA4_9PEZI|nr:hypothetical protein QC761_203510 [Podospora bellae-mahoneyi]
MRSIPDSHDSHHLHDILLPQFPLGRLARTPPQYFPLASTQPFMREAPIPSHSHPDSWHRVPIGCFHRNQPHLLWNTTQGSEQQQASEHTSPDQNWADRYYKGYNYAFKRPTALLKQYPNLFNMNTQAHTRLEQQTPAQTATPEPESGDAREFRRWERQAIPSEPFPEFTEPLLASDELINEALEMRSCRSSDGDAEASKRVDAAMLCQSGLLEKLPEFLGQLARVDLDLETRLASNPESDPVGDNVEITEKPTSELEVPTELTETQARRHGRRVILPGGRPFKLPGEEIEDGRSAGKAGGAESCTVVSDSQDPYGSGDETDASTSTTASLRVKRKRRMDTVSDEHFQPNKIRIQYTAPLTNLARQYKEMLAEHARQNPDGSSSDALADLEFKMPTQERSPSVASLTSIRVIKIKIPEGWSTPESSRSGTPTEPSPPKVIVLVNPRSRSPSPPAVASATPSRITKIKVVNSRGNPPTGSVKRSASPTKITKIKVTNFRPTTPVDSASRSTTPNRMPRIKVINRKLSPEALEKAFEVAQERSVSPESSGVPSPSGSTSSSNLEIARSSSSCSNTSLDSTWSATSKKTTRIKWANKRSSPAPYQSAPDLPASSSSERSARPMTFKIAKRPRVKSVGEADVRASKLRSSRVFLVDELDMALHDL